MKKEIGVGLIVLVLLSAASLGLVYRELAEDDSSDISVTLTPKTAKAGELVSFDLTTTGKGGTVVLPSNVFVVAQDRLTNSTQASFKGSKFTFSALLPHTMTDLDVVIKSSGKEVTFQVLVEESQSPLLSGQDYFDLERHIVDTYPGRVTGSDNFQDAINHFEGMFTEFGFQTEVQRFTREENLRQYDVWNLLGYHWGQGSPDEWIVVGAHLDIVDQTYQGAYDNGAGASAIMEIAEAVAELKTSKTVVLALWGGEEQGLWGSEYFLDNLPANVSIKTYLNFDMPGINWPGRDPFHGYIGPDNDQDRTEHPELLFLLDHAVYDVLEYPNEAFISREQEVGSGDHDTFMAAGIPSVFFFGMTFESWTTNYHTPTDTVEGMELHAGGHDALVGGFNTVAWVGYYTIILLDNDDDIHP